MSYTPAPLAPDPDLVEISAWREALGPLRISEEPPIEEAYWARRKGTGVWEQVDLAEAVRRFNFGAEVELRVRWKAR